MGIPFDFGAGYRCTAIPISSGILNFCKIQHFGNHVTGKFGETTTSGDLLSIVNVEGVVDHKLSSPLNFH